MNDNLAQALRRAREGAEAAARQAGDAVRRNAPTPEQLDALRERALHAGRTVGDGAAQVGRELSQSKTFQDGVKGAAVGAVASLPVPLVGPVFGAMVGAGVGVWLGKKKAAAAASAPPAAPEPRQPDLHDELLKLDALRRRGLLTDDEFEAQKRKLLRG